MTKTEKLVVLLVEDNQSLIEIMKRELEARGHEVLVAISLSQAVTIIYNEHRFLVALVDIHLGSAEDQVGIQVLEYIRETALHRVAPYAWTGDASYEIYEKIIEAQVIYIIPKDLDISLLIKLLENSVAVRAMRASAYDLELTRLMFFWAFSRDVMNDINLARLQWNDRRKPIFTLLYIDVDDFKVVNDVHGHHNGDEALRQVASVLETRQKFGDRVCRKSGDEFMVWLPHTRIGTAKGVAEELQRKVGELQLVNDSGLPVPLSVSIGLAEFEPLAEADKDSLNGQLILDDLVKKADSGDGGLILAKTDRRKGQRRSQVRLTGQV